LKLLRQYTKNIGRTVEIIFTNEAKQEGKLVAVSDQAVTIEYTEGKNKKAITVTKEIPVDSIKQTVVQIAF
jgi:ribosome maturation factor RimP